MASFAQIRLVAVSVGVINLILFIIVFAIPYWRVTDVSANSEALSNIYAHEGLWLECFSFYRKAPQCGQIGSNTNMGSANSRVDSTYYMYGIYAYLGAYRTLMVIALVTEIVAVALSAAGMKCNKSIEEGGRVKQWMNAIAGICHFVTGVFTCIACSWYAALVIKEQSSPFYLTTRLKYVVGGSIYIGWIVSAVSIALGCVLTCCTCFNRPVNEKYEYNAPPISEINIPPQPVDMPPVYADTEWDDGESRYTSGKSHRSQRSGRTHKSERSHRSKRSHRSERSHRSHRSDKGSRRKDGYDPYYDDDQYRRDDYDPYYDDDQYRRDDYRSSRGDAFI